MNERPLVAFAGCWVAGTGALSIWSGYGAISALCGMMAIWLAAGLAGKLDRRVAALGLLALALSAGYRWMSERDDESAIAVALAAAGAGAGNGATAHEFSADSVSPAVSLYGMIAAPVEVDGDLATFRLKTEQMKLGSAQQELRQKETVLVRVKLQRREEQQAAAALLRGTAVTVDGLLERPHSAGNFGAFDYRDYLQDQRIAWLLQADGILAVRPDPDRAPGWTAAVLRLFDGWRVDIGERLDWLYPHGDAGYMKGLVAGIRADLDPEQFDRFAQLGLTHVLAISGLHVAVIIFLLLQAGTLLRLTRERTLDLAIVALPLYMGLTGASPSAVRACLMGMLALWLARRRALKDGLHLLAAAAVLMLVWDPTYIDNVSFQLSFAVTTGLVLFVPRVAELLPQRPKSLNGALAVTLTAQAVSFPLTAYYFHAFHLLSPAANLVLVPFISFIVMPLGLASVVLGAMWLPLGIVPAYLATWGNRLTFEAVGWFEGADRWSTVWPQTSWLWATSGFVLMGVGARLSDIHVGGRSAAAWWEERRLHAPPVDETVPLASSGPYGPHPRDSMRLRRVLMPAVCLFLAIGVWLLWGMRPAMFDRSASVQFLDVGQGDAILVRTGAGKHLLVDTGGTVRFVKPGEEWRQRADPFEVGRKLLVPLLLQRGVRELEALVLTHLDTDHIGGAQAVVDRIPVKRIIFNGTIKDAPGALKLLRSALKQGIPCYTAAAGHSWTIDRTAQLRVLYPLSASAGVSALSAVDDQNGRSVTLILTLYGRHTLLSGDLDDRGEREIAALASASGERLPVIDIMKAGHHGSGSSTSAEWLRLWRPRETVISVGANNFYGHPHPDVLRRLTAAGSAVYRTDTDGEIQYRIRPDGTLQRRTKRQG